MGIKSYQQSMQLHYLAALNDMIILQLSDNKEFLPDRIAEDTCKEQAYAQFCKTLDSRTLHTANQVEGNEAHHNYVKTELQKQVKQTIENSNFLLLDKLVESGHNIINNAFPL